LWFSEPGKLDAVVVTELRQLPRKRTLIINFVAGRGLANWWPDFVETMDAYAKQNQCGAILAYARPGWTRYWKRRGIATTILTEIMVKTVMPRPP
jgi:hypothetical protein